uniref:Uncharacterized protein n=1 Tax=Anguilla anguilla TaxID=7936 RepID=A0A0E9XJN3_ANGAN
MSWFSDISASCVLIDILHTIGYRVFVLNTLT